MNFSRREYYRDRLTEYELCQDFPADELFIYGLYSMQSHFDHNGINITIPVVRVMNTAHFLAAYMFATTCSGDQMEYEALASMSCGRDRQLAKVALIVLAAMLKRTDGFRARQCRNVILDNRDEDFEEGVTLYDRFLRSADKHFSEEDFLIDTHAQIIQLQEENTRLTSENIQLKYTITTMENQQNIQYKQDNNQGTIYNAPVYITYAAPQYAASEVTSTDEPKKEASSIPPDFFCISSRFSEENIRERLDAELAQAASKVDYCRSLYRLQHIGCINIQQYASDAQRAIVFNRFQSKFNLSPDDFCRARMK